MTKNKILICKEISAIRNYKDQDLKSQKRNYFCISNTCYMLFPTGKNNGFPFLDILGYYFKEYPKKSQIWKSETSPNQGTWLGIPRLGLVSLCQILDFYGYSLNTLKYPKMGIRYFFLCPWKVLKVMTDK